MFWYPCSLYPIRAENCLLHVTYRGRRDANYKTNRKSANATATFTSIKVKVGLVYLKRGLCQRVTASAQIYYSVLYSSPSAAPLLLWHVISWYKPKMKQKQQTTEFKMEHDTSQGTETKLCFSHDSSWHTCSWLTSTSFSYTCISYPPIQYSYSKLKMAPSKLGIIFYKRFPC